MYKDSRQLRIEDFMFPYGELDAENDWVKLAALVPWDVAEEAADVPQARPEGVPPSVQKQETQREGDP